MVFEYCPRSHPLQYPVFHFLDRVVNDIHRPYTEVTVAYGNWLFPALFIAELTGLLLVSRVLISSFSRVLSGATGSRSATIYILAILFLPGTILHELAHLFSAGVLFVPVGELEVVPEIRGEEVKFGSVQIGQTDPLRRLLIGAAPVIVGTGVILSILAFAPGIFDQTTPFWMAGGILYLIFAITNTMFSSKKDLEGALAFLGALAIVAIIAVIVLKVTGYSPTFEWINKFDFSGVVKFFQKADLYLMIPLALDILLITLMKVLSLGRA